MWEHMNFSFLVNDYDSDLSLPDCPKDMAFHWDNNKSGLLDVHIVRHVASAGSALGFIP